MAAGRALDPQMPDNAPPGRTAAKHLSRLRAGRGLRTLPASLDDCWRLHRRWVAEEPAEPHDVGLSLLDLKRAIARQLWRSCILCEHRCEVDRSRDVRGRCGVGVTSYSAPPFLHEGEELEVSPSLCVPLTGCSWHCVYCHTPDLINQTDRGIPLGPSFYPSLFKLAEDPRARSLSWVGGNPDHHLPAVLDAIAAAPKHFSLPLVWNSNLYGSPELYRLLEGVVDIHLGDLRYGRDECGEALSGIPRAWSAVTRNWRLVASQPVDLIARVLILPGHHDCCIRPILAFLATEVPGARLSLLPQFHPAYRTAKSAPEMNRLPTREEVEAAARLAAQLGIQQVATVEAVAQGPWPPNR